MRSTGHQIVLLVLLLMCTLGAVAGEERIFRAITASDGLADNSAQTIKCTFTGRMTITTIGNINFYDGTRFSQINVDQEDVYTLDNYQGHYHLYYDNVHHLWLKGSHNVVCVNLTTEHFVNNMDSLFVSLGMEDHVTDMFVDVDGNIWMMGDDYVKSNKVDRHFPVRKDLNLQDLDVYDKSQLLLFYENGTLDCFDVNSGKKLYTTVPYGEGDSKAYARSGVQIPDGTGFYQIRNGEVGAILLYYDQKQREWKELMRTEYHLNNMAIHNDVLYIASEWGYFTYQKETGEIEHCKSLKLANGRRLETDINVIEFDRQGGMWLGTEKRGLLYARPQMAPFTVLTWDNPLALKYEAIMRPMNGISDFMGKKANVMLVDSRNWTWVGTPSGLDMYTEPKAVPLHITRKSGLLNNVIHSIVEDDNHNIWVSTSYGIACVLIEGGGVKRVYCFNDADNVPNETFINGKAFKLNDGTIVMQALDHVVTFHPQEFGEILNEKPVVMFPKLTKLLVNGVNVEAGDEIGGTVVLEKAITRTKEINLNYDQNSVSLTFSALNFARPLETFYRVNIREMGGDWEEYSYFNSSGLVDKQGALHLPLVGLRPGTYHIDLQVSNVPGKYEGGPYTWIININEPWWRSAGIYWLLGLLLLTLGVVNFLLFTRNTRLKAQRSNDEGDAIKRIISFVDRCDELNTQVLSPTQDERYGADVDMRTDLSEEFVEAMMKMLPYIHEQKDRKMSMRQLSDVAGISVQKLYELVSVNIYKSPRNLAKEIRLTQAVDILENTNKTIEEVADELLFSTPNYFIASFYHKYRITPQEFCEDLK